MKKKLVFAALALSLGAGQAAAQDPFQWLEPPQDSRALTWAQQETARSEAAIRAMPGRAEVRQELDQLLKAGDPPPQFYLRGSNVIRFQKSLTKPHGVLSIAERNAETGRIGDWRQVLDLEQLRADEGAPFELNMALFADACLPPEFERCLLSLSRAGADEVELREFDMRTGRFVENGFKVPASRTQAAWIDRDNLLIAHTAYGAPTLPTGWGATVSSWTRGTPLADAPILYRGQPTDALLLIGSVGSGKDRVGVIRRVIDYSNVETLMVRGGEVESTPIPHRTRMMFGVVASSGGQVVAQLSEDAEINGRLYAAESVISYNTAADVPERDRVGLVYAPVEGEFIADPTSGVAIGASTVRLAVDRRGVRQLITATVDVGEWRVTRHAPEPVGVNVSFMDADPVSDAAVLVRSGYLFPTQVSLERSGAAGRVLFTERAAFDAARFVVDLKTTRSKDGTEIDYYLVRPRSPANPGQTPTLMTGYGAFGISFNPGYLDAVVGGRSLALWLNQGGAFVLPMIRGGGERGAAWHEAAMREKRQNSYDDFAAVTEALISDGFTQPRHIGVFGMSNGGLLAAVMGTQRPDLYGAVVSDVPLTDLMRMPYMGMGAAWTDEYGDPNDPRMAEIIERYSPYQAVRDGKDYPPFLITVATSDNRVGPGHARKLAARLQQAGSKVYFLEDSEGGHGVSDPISRPDLMADRMTFLINALN